MLDKLYQRHVTRFKPGSRSCHVEKRKKKVRHQKEEVFCSVRAISQRAPFLPRNTESNIIIDTESNIIKKKKRYAAETELWGLDIRFYVNLWILRCGKYSLRTSRVSNVHIIVSINSFKNRSMRWQPLIAYKGTTCVGHVYLNISVTRSSSVLRGVRHDV